MVASQHPNPVTYFVQQAITILRTQGLASLVKRIRDHLQSHQFVYGSPGFVGIFGIQLHYLRGREAFKETKQRFLIQKRRPVSSD